MYLYLYLFQDSFGDKLVKIITFVSCSSLEFIGEYSTTRIGMDAALAIEQHADRKADGLERHKREGGVSVSSMV